MLRLKLAIDLAVTILSGSDINNTIAKKILITPKTRGNLANLNRFPRVEGYSERLISMKTQDRPGHVILCNT